MFGDASFPQSGVALGLHRFIVVVHSWKQVDLLANHRAEGRAQLRKQRGQGGTHRDASLPASAVKVGVLGAFATATIAAPLAAAAAGIDESSAAPEAAAGPVAAAPVAPAPAAPVALPVAEAAVKAPADVETRTDDAASRDQERTAPAAEAPEQDASAGTGIEVEVPEPEPEVVEVATEAGEAASSAAPISSGTVRPVSGSISSGYGYRTHPVLGSSKMHEGVDFAASCGTPVHSVKAGTVVAVEYHHASGKRVKVDHGNGVITGYYHLQSYATSVGETVDAGEVIGYVGSTGRSTGCHLHFAKMDESGTYSNPLSLLN